jgi:hypothetical protein
MQSTNPRASLMVTDAAKTLKRLYFLQRECVIAQAGWTPGTVHWETKLLWPEFLWQDALTAESMRQRVLELRFPERRVEPGEDAALIQWWRDLWRNAPGAPAFAEAVRIGFKPFMRDIFARYLSLADGIDDAPTVRILRHAVADVDEQIGRLANAGTSLAEVHPRAELDAAQAWANQIAAQLSAVDVDCLVGEAPCVPPAAVRAGAHPFAISREGKRDPRFAYSRIPWPDSLEPARGPGTGFELQVRQAQAHLNEIWATEMAAAVIFDLADDAPAEFLDDAARWCFDEARHCRMGYTRFLEWGFTKPEMPMGSFSYDAGAGVDAITRLGIIYYFETTYIHTKSERTKSFAAFGDRTSSHDMDFDWADELIHTHYGKKWLDYFLQHQSSKLTPADIKRAAEDSVARLRTEATPADRQRIDDLYTTTMARARALAAGHS